MSKKGTSTFVIQRASAVILIPFAVWLLFNIVALLGSDLETARAWFANPINGLALGGFLIVAAAHMRIGMMEIIVDYIHSGLRGVLLSMNWIFSLGVVAGVAWAVYALSFAS